MKTLSNNTLKLNLRTLKVFFTKNMEKKKLKKSLRSDLRLNLVYLEFQLPPLTLSIYIISYSLNIFITVTHGGVWIIYGSENLSAKLKLLF